MVINIRCKNLFYKIPQNIIKINSIKLILYLALISRIYKNSIFFKEFGNMSLKLIRFADLSFKKTEPQRLSFLTTQRLN